MQNPLQVDTTTYRVTYNGNILRFKDFEEDVEAYSAREAVEKVYSYYCDDDYFPQDDGSILDCDGNMIADADGDRIRYDGGFFEAEEAPEFEDAKTVLDEAAEETGLNAYSFCNDFISIIVDKTNEYTGNTPQKLDAFLANMQKEGVSSGLFGEFDDQKHAYDMEEFERELDEDTGAPVLDKEHFTHYIFEEFFKKLHCELFETYRSPFWEYKHDMLHK